MRILIYGAGVIGSLYAALFAKTGYDVSIYARGKRLEALQTKGLLYLENKSFVNAHLLKEGLALVDCTLDFKYKTKFLKLINTK